MMVARNLPLSLEDVLNGCKKLVKVNQKTIDLDGHVKSEEKEFTINVTPGTDSGKQFLFHRLGDRSPGRIPADVVFFTTNEPHHLFKRKGADIVYTAKVTSNEVKNEIEFYVPTMDGSAELVKIPKSHNQKVSIKRKGLPKSINPKERGELIVEFVLIDEKQKGMPNTNLLSIVYYSLLII